MVYGYYYMKHRTLQDYLGIQTGEQQLLLGYLLECYMEAAKRLLLLWYVFFQFIKDLVAPYYLSFGSSYLCVCFVLISTLKLVAVVLKQSKDAEVMLKMGSTQDKREQHRLMRDAMEKRFTRVTRGSLIGGMRLGMFTASYFSLQNFLAETRGVHDVFNFVGAGSATAAVFGLIST